MTDRLCAICHEPILGSYVSMKRPGTDDQYDYWHPLCRERAMAWLL